MKTSSGVPNAMILRFFTLFACLLLTGGTLVASVTFTVTPATVSNTFDAPLVLQVSGLTNAGDTVVVQKYLDANGNGVVDAGDSLWQQFTLTDGAPGMVIGTVTNFNVPGDADQMVNGQITAKLNLQTDFSQFLAAKYLFVLSSSSGHFSPITIPFTVTNFPYPQKFTGTVVSNGVTVPYAGIILFPGSSTGGGPGYPFGGTVANAAGVFTLSAPPGTYTLVPFKTNLVSSLSGAASLVLAANATVTTNLTLFAATRTISGKIVDAANSAIGLPGLLAPALSKSGLLALTTSDTNGYFSVGVTSNQWQVDLQSPGLAMHGYVGPNNGTAVTTTNGNVTGLVISVPRATALFYGTVKDTSGNPLPGEVDVSANDQNNGLYQADGYTDATGTYDTAILGGLGNGDPWSVGIGNSGHFSNYVFSQPAFDATGGTNLGSGAAVPVSFTAILATNVISGNVSCNGAALAGLGVYASTIINGVAFNNSANTDNNGNYSLAVANGLWNVGVNCQGGNGLANVGNFQCPSSQNISIANNNGLANFAIQTNLNVGGPLQVTASTLPIGLVGAAYDQQLTADGGPSGTSYYWSVVSGSLPPGLSLDNGGTLQGSPLFGGSYTFIVQVNDNNNDNATQTLTLTVSGVLQVANTSLTAGTSNVVYQSQQLSAIYGQSPYSWSVVAGALPGGLTLSSPGVISGTPTKAGTFTLVAKVTDSQSSTATQALSLIIYPGVITPAFTETPTAISNTCGGPVSLLLSSLSPGETVVIQKYLDANANGVIDAADPLWQQFNLTDGQAGMVIGGVTNFNVPGDTDGMANGQITATLHPQADFVQVFSGKYLFKLSSPAGHFSPLTNSFAVTNFPFAQALAGTIVSNGVPVPNAGVILFPGGGDSGGGLGNPVGGVIANNAGVYSLPAPPGSYTPVPFKPGFLASLNGAANLNLGIGATLATNLNLIAATETISGQIVDAANPGIGLPGVFVPAMIKNGFLAVSTAGTNGNFIVGVTPNKWSLQTISGGAVLHGYVAPQGKTSVNASNGSVSGVTIYLPKATALFYGTVQDNLGHPLPGEVAVYAADQNDNLFQPDGYADSNGNYVTGVVGGLGSYDPWYVAVDNSSTFADYDFSQPAFDSNGGTNVAAGAAVPVNITAVIATNVITGNVKFNGTNVVGVGVNAWATINGASYNLNTVNTDTNGNYSLTVAAGTWTVQVYDCSCSDSDSLGNILHGIAYQDPADAIVTITNKNATANFVVVNSASGVIYGYVTDTTGTPVANVNVSATSATASFSTTTDGNGYYSFALSDGTWTLSVDCNALTSLGYQCVANQAGTVNGDSVELDFNVSLAAGPLQIATAFLPNGIVGTYYNQQLQASGGQMPYVWSLSG